MMNRRTRVSGARCAVAIHAGVVFLLAVALVFATLGGQALAASSAEPPDAPIGERAAVPDGVDLFVARRGWHVDVGFAVDAAPESLQALVRELPGARYVFLGFGDRRYLRAHHRLPAMLAALWPGRGLILATGLTAAPAQAFGQNHVIRLHLSPQQWVAAWRFIRRSFGERGAADDGMTGEWPALADYQVGPGPYQGSLYYSASATYSAVHTCNTWVAEVLQSAGLPVRSRGVVFAGQVWGEVGRLAAADSARRRLEQCAPVYRECPALLPGGRGR